MREEEQRGESSPMQVFLEAQSDAGIERPEIGAALTPMLSWRCGEWVQNRRADLGAANYSLLPLRRGALSALEE